MLQPSAAASSPQCSTKRNIIVLTPAHMPKRPRGPGSFQIMPGQGIRSSGRLITPARHDAMRRCSAVGEAGRRSWLRAPAVRPGAAGVKMVGQPRDVGGHARPRGGDRPRPGSGPREQPGSPAAFRPMLARAIRARDPLEVRLGRLIYFDPFRLGRDVNDLRIKHSTDVQQLRPMGDHALPRLRHEFARRGAEAPVPGQQRLSRSKASRRRLDSPEGEPLQPINVLGDQDLVGLVATTATLLEAEEDFGSRWRRPADGRSRERDQPPAARRRRRALAARWS